MNKTQIFNKDEMLIIGDDPQKDIKGAIISNIDTCLFNPNDIISTEYLPTYEIKHLKELKTILLNNKK